MPDWGGPSLFGCISLHSDGDWGSDLVATATTFEPGRQLHRYDVLVSFMQVPLFRQGERGGEVFGQTIQLLVGYSGL